MFLPSDLYVSFSKPDKYGLELAYLVIERKQDFERVKGIHFPRSEQPQREERKQEALPEFPPH